MSVQVVAAHGLQVWQVADHLVMIGVDAERRALDGLAEQEVGFVFAAFALRDDDCPLGGHFFLVEQAVDHAVGFDAQA